MTLKVLYKGVMKTNDRIFTLEELCTLVDMNKRTIRFYMQRGLVDRPEGTGKGAYYTHRHLEQLLGVRKWKEAGLSLERIQELLGNEDRATGAGRPIPPPRARKAGSVEVWSHLYIREGIELHIEPQQSGLTPEQVRALCRAVLEQYKIIITEEK
jgi:DNA-binding transcriptional MerR regulator